MSDYSDDNILLKWGTLKGWNVKCPETFKLLQEYHDEPVSFSVMAQKDTDSQKKKLCEMLTAHKGTITNDWTGKEMSKKEAIKYVMEYGK